jgi:hypothetical protein
MGLAMDMDMDLLGAMIPGVVALLIIRHIGQWRLRSAQAAIRQAQELQRERLLQRLTFFFSSLRHSYNKYPPDLLPLHLHSERQAFLEHDFRNLTTLSALSLAELEDLYAAVQRECTTGKWQGGVTAVEQRMEEAVQQGNLPQGRHVMQSESGIASISADDPGGIEHK